MMTIYSLYDNFFSFPIEKSLNTIWFYQTSFLFFIGLFGVFLSRKNLIILIMCIEIMLLAVNFNLICFSVFLDDLIGEMFALFILTIGASESAIGLALIVSYYKMYETVKFSIF